MTIFIPERRMIHKFSREDVRINDSLIDSIMKWVTLRDLEILELLAFHPFLTTNQLEMMVFNNLSPSSWRNKANERIRRLYNAQCLDRFFPPVGEGMGSSVQHLILDYAGYKVLAKSKDYEGKSNWRKVSYIPQDYKHTLKVFDFKALLHVLNRQLGSTDEGTVGEIIHWGNKGYKFIHAENGRVKKKTIIPDAFCIYKYTGHGHIKSFFLECDNSTEPMKTLKDKIINYRNFYESNEWKTEKWYGALRRFPTVIFVFHEQEKVNELLVFLRRIQSNVRFLFTTYDQLFEDEWKEYRSGEGKKRLVLQNRKIKILEEIWEGKNGLETL